ncbi:medium-chain acyl-CoA ligase ACSF2, mitochondrial-like [Pecten maximus]|uniref:medium-chain acyl-CoA ligase ACSF2, mitochondrial-like n=1 Tax=Pecten maximus TaxID=6579 RepID=UPI001458788D|nr:medium-chain acyl-CoA ligase ACSF2, mitochondrial-like [Pecten maximus]
MAFSSDLSYIHNPANKPYNYTTVAEAARENAQLRPNQEILVLRELDGSRSSLTNASLYQQAEQLARYLVKQGIKKGETVALLGPNTLEMAIATLGIIKAGAVVFTIVLNMKKEDVMAQLQIVNAKFILVDCGKNDSFLISFKAILDHCGALTADPSTEHDIKVLSLRETDSYNVPVINQYMLSQNIAEAELPHIYPEDNVIIFSTSGSTGIPKMVCHSNFDCANIEQRLTENYQRIIFNDRLFFWMMGSIVNTIMRSETRVILETNVTLNSPNIDFTWRILKEETCSDALLPSSEIRKLLEMPKSVAEDRFRLKYIHTCGEIIDNYCIRAVGQLCQEMVILYGATECQDISLKIISNFSERLQTGNVGEPVAGVEIRVVDSQDNPIIRGLTGKIQVRSPLAMTGYVSDPEKTKEVFTEEQWYRTGDIGKVSLNGNLIIQGREIEVVTRGSKRIYPSMLEAVFKDMEAIKEVCVVPVPDKKLHEEVCVCFVPCGKLTPEDVKQFFKENHSKAKTFGGSNEIPPYFLQFETFPKLGSGKLDKKAIRQQATSTLELTMEYDS